MNKLKPTTKHAIILISLIFMQFSAKAQKINIFKISGNKTTIELNYIQKIYFKLDTMIIEDVFTQIDYFPLDSVRTITFHDTIFTGTDNSIIYSGKDLNLVKIYPNPCESQLKIEFSAKINFPLRIELYNFNGQLVYRNILNANYSNYTINLSKLKNGIYFCRFSSNKHIENFKIIKE